MVEGDVGNHADPRLDHVGSIETTAHAHFENGNLHLSLREIFECHGGQHFKKTGVPRQVAFTHQALGRALDDIVEQGKLGIADFLVIDPNALVDPHQIWRCVKAGP